jgi:GGDEF domain-containing protein
LLREVGVRVSHVLRESDTGDEFAILLPYTSVAESIAVCAKILAAIRRPLTVGERGLVDWEVSVWAW